MKKLFKVTFASSLQDEEKEFYDILYVVAKDWQQVGKVYENAKMIELITNKAMVIKEYA
jgi:hypothetical protein